MLYNLLECNQIDILGLKQITINNVKEAQRCSYSDVMVYYKKYMTNSPSTISYIIQLIVE